MAEIGRNDPRRCGSGKMYRKCCLAKDEALATAEAAQQRAAPPTLMLENDGLDALSNSVVDLIHEGRLDEAMAPCEKLQRDYPEVIDGLEAEAGTSAGASATSRRLGLSRAVVRTQVMAPDRAVAVESHFGAAARRV